MVVSVLPYSIYTTCKCRHSTYQHRLVVGFVSVHLGPTLTEALDVYLRLKGKDKGITFWKDQTGPRN